MYFVWSHTLARSILEWGPAVTTKRGPGTSGIRRRRASIWETSNVDPVRSESSTTTTRRAPVASSRAVTFRSCASGVVGPKKLKIRSKYWEAFESAPAYLAGIPCRLKQSILWARQLTTCLSTASGAADAESKPQQLTTANHSFGLSDEAAAARSTKLTRLVFPQPKRPTIPTVFRLGSVRYLRIRPVRELSPKRSWSGSNIGSSLDIQSSSPSM